jgi:hypothetical protein
LANSKERKADSGTGEHAIGSRHLTKFGAGFMNWLAIAVVGAAAAWFEYNYQRSRPRKKKSPADAPSASELLVPEPAHVAEAGESPSISPGAENDKKLNTTA